jgi:integrase
MESYEHREPWNKGKLVGQKAPLKPKDIWAIRIHLQNAHHVRDLAMFNLAIDSKLRGCDLVGLRVRAVTHGSQVLSRAMVIQSKTQRPVQSELIEPTRTTVATWIEKAKLKPDDFLFPSRLHHSPHVSTRPSSCCSAIPSSSRQSVTPASRSMMPRRSSSRSRSDGGKAARRKPLMRRGPLTETMPKE